VQGKVALITGAARGQGRSHAVRLAEEGADIIAIDLCEPVETTNYPGATEDDLKETVRAVEALGRRIFATKADVRDYATLAPAVAAGVDGLGRLDIVAANAGITSNAAITAMTEAQWGQMIDINLSGVWRTCKAAVPHILAGERGGSITITSSVLGLRGAPGMTHYAAAKHGVVGIMRSLAYEMGSHGIRVNTIHPTQVGTAMLFNEDTYGLFRPDLEHPTVDDFAEASQSLMLLEVPWVEPIDISNALVFLASDEARFITGVTLPVDAGLLTK
jgi:SDR family mycofactocin-dependent oxidoreductase